MNETVKDPLFILIIISFNVVVSIWLENRTVLRTVGAAILVIVITAFMANIGIIPSARLGSGIYDSIFSYIDPISIFYLLLGVSLRHLKTPASPCCCLSALGQPVR